MKIAASSPASPAVRLLTSTFRPGSTKYAGSRSAATATIVPRAPSSAAAPGSLRGTTSPNAKAPMTKWMPISSVTPAHASVPATSRAAAAPRSAAISACRRPRARPSAGRTTDHQRDHEQRQLDGDACRFPRAGRSEHGEHQHDQRPAEHVVHGGGGEHQRAQPAVGHVAIDEDPGQHREGRDRHRRADEQRERQEVTTAARRARGAAARRSRSRARTGRAPR